MESKEPHPVEKNLRSSASMVFELVEGALYIAVAAMMLIAAVLGLIDSGRMIWQAVSEGPLGEQTVRVMESLLLVLMLVEILHTVRVSVKAHRLVTVPFLIVGVIAGIRRMLVITLEAANLLKLEKWNEESRSLFYGTMVEMAVLALLILVLVFCIVLVRRSNADKEESEAL